MKKFKYSDMPAYSEMPKKIQKLIIEEVREDFPEEAELLENGNLEDEDTLQNYVFGVLEDLELMEEV